MFPVLVAVLIAWNIRRLVFKEGLPSRLDVFDIAFNVVIFYYWTSAGIKDWGNVWDGYWATRDKTGLKQPPDHQS